MQEHGQAGSHNQRQHGPSTRPKQLRDREVPWEGSRRSKRMSRRTERPYQVDGAGELAPHRAARCSAPEINGPAVQQEFTSLLREACSPGSADQPSGAALSHEAVRLQESAEAVVPRARAGEHSGKSHHWEGLNWAGRHDPRVLSRSVAADRLSYRAAITVAEKECCAIREDCQEPPDADPHVDPHVRWCGGREVNPPGYPIRPTMRKLA